MRHLLLSVFVSLAFIIAGCQATGEAPSIEDTDQTRSAQNIIGVWQLVEVHDWNPEGVDVGSLGESAPGLFVYTPAGYLSLHIMTEHQRERVTRSTSDADLGRIYKPYIGYFGTYTVDGEAMTVTHHIEGAKLPNRIGRSAVRDFYFEDGDLVLDFTNDNGWRFYRRLKRLENLR